MNGFTELLKKIGLSPDDTAKLADLTAYDVRDVLNKQSRHVDVILAVCRAAGIKLVVQPSPTPLSAAVQLSVFDNRLTSDLHRQAMGLRSFPTTRGEVRRTVVNVRDNRRHFIKSKTSKQKSRLLGMGAAAKILEENWIPTSSGRRRWTRSTVLDHTRNGWRKCANDDQLVVPSPEMVLEWRDFAIDKFLADLVWFDPGAAFRWGFDISRTETELVIKCARLPRLVYDTVMSSVSRQPDMEGRWRTI